MEKSQVLQVIEHHVRRAAAISADDNIDPQKKLIDYGLNSLDIVEVVSGSMRELKVRIPRTELADIQNIDGLADKLIQYSN
ncbi:MAG: acyl carrier protein [Saprospiraceae bacterium]|nr:acyl carrier protein [Saprospiraceae bacterium]